jgi:hypothetical protein
VSGSVRPANRRIQFQRPPAQLYDSAKGLTTSTSSSRADFPRLEHQHAPVLRICEPDCSDSVLVSMHPTLLPPGRQSIEKDGNDREREAAVSKMAGPEHKPRLGEPPNQYPCLRARRRTKRQGA